MASHLAPHGPVQTSQDRKPFIHMPKHKRHIFFLPSYQCDEGAIPGQRASLPSAHSSISPPNHRPGSCLLSHRCAFSSTCCWTLISGQDGLIVMCL